MKHPLMNNNIPAEQLHLLAEYLKTNPMLTSSGKVREFEELWSNWLGTKYSVMVNSGSSANFATLLALKNITSKKKILLSPLTWVSDINSIFWAGFEPEFLDISLNTLSINENLLDQVNPDDIACIFITHVLGLNGLTDQIIEYANKFNIPIIEDCCESHGTTFKGNKVGTHGLASNFSFYYAHHLTTIEGGIVSTDDKDFYNLLKLTRAHGMLRESSSEKYKDEIASSHDDLHEEFVFPVKGFNFRPTEINAFLGIEQLKDLDKNNIKRNENFLRLLNQLPDYYYKEYNTDGMSNYAFLVMLNDPDVDKMHKLISNLKGAEIEYRRGMSGGGNQLRQPYFQCPQKNDLDSFKNTDHVHHFGLYIGNFPSLEAEMIDYIAKSLKF